MINFDKETNIEFEFNIEELMTKVINYCLNFLDCPYETEINILLTDNVGIHEINRESRGIDKPTDVLSFPFIDYEKPCVFNLSDIYSTEYFNPDTGELILGDMVISLEKVIEQAEEYGHSQLRELAFLTVHSVLHLFGYDHIEPSDALIMEDKQKRIMSDLNINR
ncbi:MAG: rRNA maturation RNase YbeY [Eubacterium sp.]